MPLVFLFDFWMEICKYFRVKYALGGKRMVDMIMKEILDYMDREIKNRGFTKKEIAQKLGVSPSALSSMFTRQNIKLSLAIRIADIIGVSPRAIFPQDLMDGWLDMPLIDLIRNVCQDEIKKVILNSKIENGIILKSTITPKK